MIDKKTFWIGIMTVVAAVLIAAHAMQPAFLPAAYATQEAVEAREFSMATTTAANGGEVLYILDKRTGRLVAVGWDNQTRRPVQVAASVSLPVVFSRR